jgi:phage gpG-like protein
MKGLIDKLIRAKETAFKDIVATAEVETENFIQDNFDKEGFVNKSLSKWEPVKRKDGGKILTGTRQLADTLEVTATGSTIKITSPKAYAEIHNKGGKAGRNGSANIPQRKFIGESKTLNKKIGLRSHNIIHKHLNT